MAYKISFLGRLYNDHHHDTLEHRIIKTELTPIDWLNEQQKNYAALMKGEFNGTTFQVKAIYSWLEDKSDE